MVKPGPTLPAETSVMPPTNRLTKRDGGRKVVSPWCSELSLDQEGAPWGGFEEEKANQPW